MNRNPGEANSCTIELSTGSLIEVAHTPKDVLGCRTSAIPESDGRMLRLTPLIGTSRSDSDYRQFVWVDPRHIVAIYPLDERSIPPRRVYVDRVEATTT